MTGFTVYGEGLRAYCEGFRVYEKFMVEGFSILG